MCACVCVCSLPGRFLCGVPSNAFENLGERDTLTIIQSINVFCNGTEDLEVFNKSIHHSVWCSAAVTHIPSSLLFQITAALAANLPSITSAFIQLLGSQSIGLSEAQIISTPPQVIKATLSTLSNVTGWNQGQANAIVQTLTESGFSVSHPPNTPRPLRSTRYNTAASSSSSCRQNGYQSDITPLCF